MALVFLLLVVQIPGWWMTFNLISAMRRCYEYAAARAKEYGAFDPAGRAYSDMATVIALDGDCEPRAHIRPIPTQDN